MASIGPRIRPYFGVARAPFLALPVVLVASGVAAGAYHGAFSGVRALLALVGLLAAHVAVNALNEASDYRTGIDLETERTPFSGGSGTLPAGELSPRAATLLALVGFLVALAVGVWFVVEMGWPIVPVIVAGAFCVLCYTSLLARVGLGELTAGLGLGALPVIGAAMVQVEGLGPPALAACVPAFFMTFNLLLLNEFPDEAPDRKGGRRNLVILLGRPRAAAVYVAAGLLTPLSLAVSVAAGWLPPPALAAVAPSALLAPPVRWALTRPREPVPIPALGANVVWNLATNGVLAAALLVEIVR